jgi:predicted MPP superfamily phosphohydrolase
MKRRAFLRTLSAGATGAVVGGASWGLHERLHVAVTRETLHVTGLPDPFRGFRIALLTDFHRSGLVSADLIATAVTTAMRERPDLVVLGGDFVTHFDARFAGPVAEVPARVRAPGTMRSSS